MSVLRRLGRLVLALVLLRRRRRGALVPPPAPPDPRHRDARSDPRAELAAGALLALSGLLGAAVLVLIAVGHPDTQLLGLAIGAALICVAVALVLAAKRVAPRETHVEERAELDDRGGRHAVADELRAGLEGISRRRLLASAAGVAGLGFGAAFVGTAASLGPNVAELIDDTPWRRGRRVVDEHGRPILADDIVLGSFATGYPEGADRRELGSPIVIVRVRVAELALPPGREGWAPEGILAYSKICTHAGCAVALYRAPLHRSTSREPALVCPCHYSTFDVARGAKVIFGPAGRSLPQLPLAIDGEGRLVANGGFSGSIGPAWWSAKR